MGLALEQLSAEAAAAKGIADERIGVVEGEAAWHKESLSRQLDEVRTALDVASANLVAEQAAATRALTALVAEQAALVAEHAAKIASLEAWKAALEEKAAQDPPLQKQLFGQPALSQVE